MLEKIIFSLIAFVLFVYMFLFKLIKKNDTTYLVCITAQALGILLNFVQILTGYFSALGFKIVIVVLCIVFPLGVFILENKGQNFTELVYLLISKFYIKKGNNKKAKEILISLVSRYSNSYHAHKSLAEIYETEGGMRKAIDEYVKVIDIKGDDFKSYYKICILLNDLKKTDEAIQMLQNLTKKKPEYIDAIRLLGDLLYEKGKYKETINIYLDAVKNNPKEASFCYELGIVYSRINEFSLAKKCFERAVQLDEKLNLAFYKLGQISLLYRDLESAEINFKKALENQTLAKAYYQLAKIVLMKNDKAKALIYIMKAIDEDSSFYEKIISEPMFFSIKLQIEKPKHQNISKKVIISKKEKEIDEYLDDTYNLTKILNKKNENKKNSQFKTE